MICSAKYPVHKIMILTKRSSLSLLFLLGASSLWAVTPPTLNPAEGQSFSVFPLLISCPDAGAEIRYTVNGMEPTLNDQKVESGETILVNRNWIIKAKAWVAGTESTTTTGDFILTGDIAAGGSHSLALSAEGKPFAWGLQTSGRLSNLLSTASNVTLPGVTSFSSAYTAPVVTIFPNDLINNDLMVAAGGDHSLFLKKGGSVWAAGLNTSSQLGDQTVTLRTAGVRVKNSPATFGFLTGCTDIAAGDSFSLALASNGEVWSWGSKVSGSVGDGTTTGTRTYAGKVFSGTSGSVPLVGIGKISAFGSSSLALEPATGNVWAWGANGNGQLGQGNITSLSRALRVKVNSTTFLTDALDISNGRDHSAILRWNTSDPLLQGRVFCFGNQQYGRLGNNSVAVGNVTYPVQVVKSGGIPLDRIVSIECGTAHSLALDLDGKVWAWGYNVYGALGDNTVANSGFAVKVKDPSGTGDLSNIVRIAAGGKGLLGHSLAVASDGRVYAWGYNVNGQLGIGTASTTVAKLPVLVGNNLDLLFAAPEVTVAASLSQSQAPGIVTLTATPTDTDNNVQSVEFYCQGKLVGIATSAPWQVTVENLAAGTNQVYAKAIDSTGLYGTSVAINFSISSEPTSADHDRDGLPNAWETLNGLNPLESYGNDGADGDMDGDGFSNFWEYLQGSTPNDANSLPKGMISTYDGHTVALATDGRVWCWGQNTSGVLGDGTTTNRNSPTLVPRVHGMKRIVKVGTGGNFTLALDEAGCLWGWGSNTYKVLSSSATSQFLSPVKIDLKNPISNFSCGNNHIIATDRNGGIWTWGDNTYGQLGFGHTNVVVSPNQLSRPPGMGEVISLEASLLSSYAVDLNGKVWSWGYNNNGRLGDGTSINRSVPVSVSLASGLPAIQTVRSTDGHVIAIGTNGSVWTWGYNVYGQLGTGNTTQSLIPVSISSGFSLGKQVAGGFRHSLVISQTGAVWAWGNNSNGQLGTGSTTFSYTPTNSSILNGSYSLEAISAGSFHSVALQSDGSLWSWGYSIYGQLGHGNNTQLTIPTKLLTLKLTNDDSDLDGMADSWERFYFGTLTQTANGVFTVGGVTNSVAYLNGLKPTIIDNDTDGLTDIVELTNGLDPLDWSDSTGDLDGDRIPNIWEYFMSSSMYDPSSVPSVTATVSSTQSIQTVINSITGNTSNPPWIIVHVKPGVYKENVTLPFNKRILLLAAPGAIPEIQGTTTAETLYMYGDSVIEGFRITHAKDKSGNGVLVSLSGGYLLARIVNCMIHDNWGNNQGGGIEVQSGRVAISQCTIFRNSATSQGNALWVATSSTARVRNSIFWNPTGDASTEVYSNGISEGDRSIVGDTSISGASFADPLLNFSGYLTKSSPCRFQGGSKGMAKNDIERDFRGSMPDIGADQFADSDNDGLPDWIEALGVTSSTADNDSDGISNLQEYTTGTNPLLADTDNDGLNDSGEIASGTNPFNNDSDADGMLDGKEVLYGLSPLDDSDALEDMDGDRIPNAFEIGHNTLPNSAASVPLPSITVDQLLVGNETQTAKKTIMAAVASPDQPPNGYQIIRVKPGTYTETVTIDSTTSRKVLLLGDLGVNMPVISSVTNNSLWILQSNAVIDGFWIRRNIANNTSNRGIQVTMDAFSDQCRFINCRITGYTASTASVINIDKGRATVAHCTIMDNSGTNSSTNSSRAIDVALSCELTVQNSILWNIDIGATKEIHESTAGSTIVTSSIIKGGAFGAIASPPLTDRYYCLMSGSPGIGTGTLLPVSSKDIHGDSRSLTSPDIGSDQRIDSDADGLPDWWEILYFANLTKTSSGDNDSPTPDRITNWYEYLLGLNPLLGTSPGSIISDSYQAVFIMQADPWYPLEWWLDPDNDGLTNNYEAYYGSNPLILDTNGDGISDFLAVQSGISTTSNDTDGDGVLNSVEILNGTNPLLSDTDGDGVNDNLDPLPLDSSISSLPAPSPSDVTPPTITLQKPAGAVQQP